MKAVKTILSCVQLLVGFIFFTATAPADPVPEAGVTGLHVELTGARTASIRWETPQPESSLVEWGRTEKLGRRVHDPTLRRNHEIHIKDLKWKARHYYRLIRTDGQTIPSSDVFWFDNAINFTRPDVSDAVWPNYGNESSAQLAQQSIDHILEATEFRKGYALVYGLEDGRIAFELARHSHLTIICADDDAERLDRVADRFVHTDVYGVRIKVRYVEDLMEPPFPNRFFNLITTERTNALPGNLSVIREMLRPHGGTFVARKPPGSGEAETPGLSWSGTGSGLNTVKEHEAEWLHLTREADPGTTWWTHQYGGPHNAGNNFDQLGGAQTIDDLKLQWIGRPGLDAGLDRQVRMPAPVSCNGRMYHQGWNRIMAADSYNGAILWSLEIPGLRRVNLPRDSSNMCADEEAVYLAVEDTCWRIEGNTGRRSDLFRVDRPEMDWGIVFRQENLLFGSTVRRGSIFTRYWGEDHWYVGYPGLVWGGTHEAAANPVLSDELFAVDLTTGQRRWNYNGAMVLNTTVAFGEDILLFVESRSPQIQHQVSGQGGTVENALRVWDDIHLVALDPQSGEKLWEKSLSDGQQEWPKLRGGVAAFYLLTAKPGGTQVAVIQSSYPLGEDDEGFKPGAEDNGVFGLHAFSMDRNGAEPLWSRQQRWKWVVKKKLRRALIVKEQIVLGSNLYQLRDGTVRTTGMPDFGCGTLTAVGNLLIGRFNDAGDKDTYNDVSIWDMESEKLSSWTPLRPSCWLSTISGGGMLLAPEAGGGCSCQVYFGASACFAP